MELKGIVKQVGKTQKVSDLFSKRELILKTDYQTKYPQYLVIQFTQANCDKLDNVNPGELVSVSINLRGREWNGPNGLQYFNTIEGWNIKKDEEAPSKEEPTFTDGEGDSLPF